MTDKRHSIAKHYPAEATQTAFLLGGIGTGSISIGSRGQLCDFELFNRPGKGVKAPYAFFSIWAKKGDEIPVTRVLESKLLPPYSGPDGIPTYAFGGLPRLDSSVLSAEYPFVELEFKDNVLPVSIRMEAFTPFIPLNADDSGIPAAVIRYFVKNNTSKKTAVSIAASMPNMSGYEGLDSYRRLKLNTNVDCRYQNANGCEGLYFSCHDNGNKALQKNNMSLFATNGDISYKPKWLESGWTDGVQDFWLDFSEDGRLESEQRIVPQNGRFTPYAFKVGSLASTQTIEPGEEVMFEFAASWYFPLRPRSWDDNEIVHMKEDCDFDKKEIEKNYYAVQFDSSWDAGCYLIKNLSRLEEQSRDFTEALMSSSYPDYVLDALSSNITVLRSPTCFRISNGTFLAYEGCNDINGSCEGSCTHVWNYAQTLAFLFPELERSMRLVEFNLETNENGAMAHRTMKVFDKPRWGTMPASDGQLGTIIRLYRDWKLSGDKDFLEKVWVNAVKAIDYAFTAWDSDNDFVLDAEQHNTYDVEFYGPNSLSNSIFLGALKAMSEMAEYLGHNDLAQKYNHAWAIGSAKTDTLLWGGEYYVQRIDDVDRFKYQYGNGCLSDQIFGQFLAHVANLGYILPEEHVKRAISSIHKYNLCSLDGYAQVQRGFALNDEKGLLLCSWPNGGRPVLPFVYSDEVWTGVEYQVAAHLIYEGYVDEGLEIVKTARERFDGYKRNPFSEAECGYHYARSLSSWTVLTALSGFKFDLTKDNHVSFEPRINEDFFQSFWSTGKAWGTYKQERNSDGEIVKTLTVLYGDKNTQMLDKN